MKKLRKTNSMSTRSIFNYLDKLPNGRTMKEIESKFDRNLVSLFIEVLETKRIIFTENKQADKKFVLEEFFNSATTETEFKF